MKEKQKFVETTRGKLPGEQGIVVNEKITFESSHETRLIEFSPKYFALLFFVISTQWVVVRSA